MKNGDPHQLSNLTVEMSRGKLLPAAEDNIFVKDIVKGITREAVATELDCRVRTVQRYLESPAPRKIRSDESVSKEDGGGKGSMSTLVQLTQEAWEDKQTNF